MGYYANDPVAKKKAQDELEALKQKATELRERKRLILEKLKAESAPSPAPSSESASSGTADEQKKEILESELKTLKEMLRKQSTAATGLEKLVGFYASDPQQQQKTMAELQEMKGKIEELKTRQKQITVELKEIKDKAASQKAPGIVFSFAL
jgi:chromosome segregation ATPase